MLKEFKNFILRGNLLDMSIAFIMGAAFTALVKSLTDNLISPFIGLFGGGLDFKSLVLGEFKYGAFITDIINFLITAFVVFLLLKGFTALKNMGNKEDEEDSTIEDAVTSPSEEYLKDIRDLLEKQQLDSTKKP